jgi:hypothetical protein
MATIAVDAQRATDQAAAATRHFYSRVRGEE